MNKEKVTRRIHPFMRCLLGAISGFLSAIPFFQNRDFEETFKLHEDYENPLMGFLKRRIPYVIGMLIGFVLFFYMPIIYFYTNYSLGIYGLLCAFALMFGIYSGIKVYRSRTKELKHIVPSLLLFVIGAVLPAVASYVNIPQMIYDIMADYYVYILVFLACLLGSFFVSFSGMSISTFFYLLGMYLVFANTFGHMIRLEGDYKDALFYAVFLGGLALGYILSIPLRKKKLDMERNSFNLGLYISALVVIALTNLRNPNITNGWTTGTAQMIVTIVIAFAGLGVAFAFTYHGYRILNEDEILEENENKEEPSAPSLAKIYRDNLFYDLEDKLVASPSIEKRFVSPKEKPEKEETTQSGINLDKLKNLQKELEE